MGQTFDEWWDRVSFYLSSWNVSDETIAKFEKSGWAKGLFKSNVPAVRAAEALANQRTLIV